MKNLLAQGTPIGNFDGLGPLGNTRNLYLGGANTGGAFEKVISLVIGVLTVSAGLWFLFQIFTGAISWISSGGDKQAVQNAQKRMSHAIIGLFVLVAAYGLIATVELVFGLQILDFQGQFLNLRP
ncbi:MAG: hypothetical protein AAB909_03830 [Patescibacteria group bacterium]